MAADKAGSRVRHRHPPSRCHAVAKRRSGSSAFKLGYLHYWPTCRHDKQLDPHQHFIVSYVMQGEPGYSNGKEEMSATAYGSAMILLLIASLLRNAPQAGPARPLAGSTEMVSPSHFLPAYRRVTARLASLNRLDGHMRLLPRLDCGRRSRGLFWVSRSGQSHDSYRKTDRRWQSAGPHPGNAHGGHYDEKGQTFPTQGEPRKGVSSRRF
jgi:hypothetical protein